VNKFLFILFAEGKQYEPSAFAKATAGQERKGAL
jgi:hypothetical protein